MNENKNYRKLLNKMLMIENVGEAIYKSLTYKTKEKDLKLVYERLALNERETARYIEKEILKISNHRSMPSNAAILRCVKIICNALTVKALGWIIRSALKRRIYAKWHNGYKNTDQDFWRRLLRHENLQHEILSPVCDDLKKTYYEQSRLQ